MSAAAEDAVKGYTDPRVKGSARALLDTIAERIPEGATMTAPIALNELATMTGYGRRTVWTALELLVSLNLVRVVGGGRGRMASYELLPLPGAGADPTLPLIGRARPPRAADVGPLFETPADLSDATADRPASDVRAYTVGSFCLRWLTNVCSFCLRCVAYVGSFCLRWLPQGVDDQRARDVHTFKNVHTHTAPADTPPSTGPPDPEPSIASSPLVIVHPWHAWCGPVCVPKGLHQAWLQKGHPATWLFAFYARRCLTVSAEDARRAVDEFRFWRAALAVELAPTRASPRPAEVAPPDDVWAQVLERLETKLNRHDFYTWFRAVSLAEDRGAVIEVTGPAINREWIQKHYGDIVRAAIEEVRPGARVEFVADDQRRHAG